MAVDDLFDGAGAPERPDPMPHLWRWVTAAAVMVAIGPCCCTGPLGAFIAIYTWTRAGDEIARSDAGISAASVGQEARKVRQRSFGLMSLSLLILTVQAALFGLYQSVIGWLAETIWPPILELYLVWAAPG
ncbi:MAG: hypothetical protein EXR71_09970 [Myxococcales bacterium]|nr:hypothetical protein [Myxococcales bacterium]